MPQLDQFTYFTQFFWLCLFYMTFYILLYNDGLPKISRILKLRAYLVSQQFGDGSAPDKTLLGSTVILEKVLKKSFSYLHSSYSYATGWCNTLCATLNQNQLKNTNKSMLAALGEMGVSEIMKNVALEASAPVTSSTGAPAKHLNRIYTLRILKCLLSNIKTKRKKK